MEPVGQSRGEQARGCVGRAATPPGAPAVPSLRERRRWRSTSWWRGHAPDPLPGVGAGGGGCSAGFRHSWGPSSEAPTAARRRGQTRTAPPPAPTPGTAGSPLQGGALALPARAPQRRAARPPGSPSPPTSPHGAGRAHSDNTRMRASLRGGSHCLTPPAGAGTGSAARAGAHPPLRASEALPRRPAAVAARGPTLSTCRRASPGARSRGRSTQSRARGAFGAGDAGPQLPNGRKY